MPWIPVPASSTSSHCCAILVSFTMRCDNASKFKLEIVMSWDTLPSHGDCKGHTDLDSQRVWRLSLFSSCARGTWPQASSLYKIFVSWWLLELAIGFCISIFSTKEAIHDTGYWSIDHCTRYWTEVNTDLLQQWPYLQIVPYDAMPNENSVPDCGLHFLLYLRKRLS